MTDEHKKELAKWIDENPNATSEDTARQVSILLKAERMDGEEYMKFDYYEDGVRIEPRHTFWLKIWQRHNAPFLHTASAIIHHGGIEFYVDTKGGGQKPTRTKYGYYSSIKDKYTAWNVDSQARAMYHNEIDKATSDLICLVREMVRLEKSREPKFYVTEYYPVVLSKVSYGWTATFPNFPQLNDPDITTTFGDTVEEAFECIQERLSGWVDRMVRNGEELPKPTAVEDIKHKGKDYVMMVGVNVYKVVE